MTWYPQGEVRLDELVERIRCEFPQLKFTRAALDDSGEDHAVVVLDDEWVFRFPRGSEPASFSAGERRVLTALGGRGRLAVPTYRFVAPDGRFGGYRMVRGEALTASRFECLGGSARARVLDEIGDFLSTLHALPVDLADTGDAGRGRGHPSGPDYADEYAKRRRTFAAALRPDLIVRIDGFYDRLPHAIGDTQTTLVHGDLTEDHVLLAPMGDRLAGIIDFTDAGRGDPAFDHAFLWAYGDRAAEHVATRASGAEDAGRLLERSRWWFARYRIDQMWWSLKSASEPDLTEAASDLSLMFSSLDV